MKRSEAKRRITAAVDALAGWRHCKPGEKWGHIWNAEGGLPTVDRQERNKAGEVVIISEFLWPLSPREALPEATCQWHRKQV